MKKALACMAAIAMMLSCFPLAFARDANIEGMSAQDQAYLEAALLAVEEGHVIILEPDDSVDAELRGVEVPCDRPGCTGTIKTTSTTYGTWKNTGATRACAKDWRLNDLEQSRTVFTQFQCNRCGYGFDTTSSQYQWYCGH